MPADVSETFTASIFQPERKTKRPYFLYLYEAEVKFNRVHGVTCRPNLRIFTLESHQTKMWGVDEMLLQLRKIWGFHGGDYEECRLLGYKTPVRTSQGTNYVSATEPRRLMLCKIWRFHGGDYEECRLLGYKTPGRTSRKTHYVSVTESSQLMLCKISVFHGGDCEECRLLGYRNQFILHRRHITSPLQSPAG
jgi:hypothetical protein